MVGFEVPKKDFSSKILRELRFWSWQNLYIIKFQAQPFMPFYPVPLAEKQITQESKDEYTKIINKSFMIVMF